ncbi:hypothetical protein FGO68_gene6847 [Halteria grandinella]|uniref:Uncharacterized protein n=1 Tax=Halteria grandinella TaxID=5974 RepID=A0A8J8NB41_HALGN|nr:hypothetical protein FGO68_gene6847 [Halteria grandinella]
MPWSTVPQLNPLDQVTRHRSLMDVDEFSSTGSPQVGRSFTLPASRSRKKTAAMNLSAIFVKEPSEQRYCAGIATTETARRFFACASSVRPASSRWLLPQLTMLKRSAAIPRTVRQSLTA